MPIVAARQKENDEKSGQEGNRQAKKVFLHCCIENQKKEREGDKEAQDESCTSLPSKIQGSVGGLSTYAIANRRGQSDHPLVPTALSPQQEKGKKKGKLKAEKTNANLQRAKSQEETIIPKNKEKARLNAMKACKQNRRPLGPKNGGKEGKKKKPLLWAQWMGS